MIGLISVNIMTINLVSIVVCRMCAAQERR